MKGNVFLAVMVLSLVTLFFSCSNPVNSGIPASSDANSTQLASQRAFDTTGWTLIWSDEFTGTAVDTTKWNMETGNGSGGWGNAELEYYQAANATVSGGYLNITAKKESVGGFSFTSARMQTKGKVTAKYGKIAARIKNPEGMGMWPAFWMLGTNIDSVGWPACGEIDIMEMAGGTNDYKTLSTCHWSDVAGAYANYGLYYINAAKLSADYHVYEVEWDASYIRAKFDGIEYYVIDITPAALSEFQNNFYLLLNLAVGGQFFGGTASTVSQITATFPQTMSVDWVRIYSKSGTATATPTATATATAAPTATATTAPTATPSSTITYGVDYSGTTGKIWFKPGWTAVYTDVHYKLNSGSQLNYRMTYNTTTARWEQTITGLASGTVVSYFFTYEKSGLAYDTAWYSYTASGTATATPTATPTIAPTATPTVAPTTIAAPGVVSSNVGAIANGSTSKWTVSPSSAGNYRVKITSTGTTANYSIALTFNGTTIPLSIGKGATVNCDFANVTTGNKTLSIKATTAGVSIGKLELVKY